jgi:hypothetical protein
MAQDMTSPYTTPVVRNRSFSIFKSETTGEDTMTSTSSKPATKSTGAAAKAQRQAQLTVVQTSEQVSADLAALQAARRTLDEQIKTARANQPAKPEKPAKQARTLADVVSAQTARPRTDLPRIVATYTLQRESAGQDRYQALDEVLAQVKSIVLGSLDARQPGETYHQAIFRYLGRADLLTQPSDEPDAAQ